MSKKTLYYRVRAYRVVNRKTVYSSWSKVVKVKKNNKKKFKNKCLNDKVKVDT